MKKIIIFSIFMLSYSIIIKANDVIPSDIENKENNNRTIELLLSPVNLAPDIVSNTLVLLFNPLFSYIKYGEVSNIWPIISITSPILGPIMGTMDSWYGYPFWNPVGLDEHRKY